MDDYLVFQLYAPLASWGGQAVGEVRPDDTHPGRSALLGLLAAALGIRREEEEKHQALSDACRFGIALLAPGLALQDFHTIQVPPATRGQQHLQTRRDELREPRIGTTLSFRSYQQDAVSVIAVTSHDARFRLELLLDALLKPVFPLYLGRKACPPALPLNPKVIPALHLKAALDSYHIAPELERLCSGPSRYYWEAGMNPGMKHSYQSPRYDQPLNRQRWQFVPRPEFVCLGGE